MYQRIVYVNMLKMSDLAGEILSNGVESLMEEGGRGPGRM
jgi:hypothetical protein